jgi:propionyl-CoA synthetase
MSNRVWRELDEGTDDFMNLILRDSGIRILDFRFHIFHESRHRDVSSSSHLSTMLCTRLLQRRFFSAASSIKSTVQASAYAAEFKKSVENPAAFWAEKAKNVQWMVPPPTASLLSQDANGIHRWFKGGKLNVSMLATEVQAKERPDQAAIICDSPVTKTKHTLSFKELDEQVGRMAYVLQNEFNIKKGDVVAVYMPMIAEAVIAMLAITRIGAIHTVIFGGFAPHELHTRFSDTQPRMVITASGSIEIEKVLLFSAFFILISKFHFVSLHIQVVSYPPMVDAALKLYNQPSLPVLCVHRTEMPQASITAPSAWPSNYRDWKTLMNKHQGKRAAAVACDATDPLYVLYTSGSTGKPKGIPRDHGSVVALKYAMDSVMKAKPGSVYWAGSDVGWVVGTYFSSILQFFQFDMTFYAIRRPFFLRLRSAGSRLYLCDL